MLLTNLQSLQVLLAGAVTTTQPVLYAGFADHTSTAFTPGTSTGATNGTTAVTWVAAPAASTVRQAKMLSLFNADTAAVTATVRVNDNGTNRTLLVVTLRAGERLEYVDGQGFKISAGSSATAAITYGTYAARPAAASVSPNTVYFATNVGEAYVSNGSTWTLLPAGGSELGYAEITTTFSTASTTAVDVPGLSVNVTVGERPVVMAYGGNLRNTNGLGFARLLAVANGVNSSNLTISGAAGYQALSRMTRIAGLTPGTAYIFKLQLLAIAMGTAELYADSTDRPYLQVRTA